MNDDETNFAATEDRLRNHFHQLSNESLSFDEDAKRPGRLVFASVMMLVVLSASYMTVRLAFDGSTEAPLAASAPDSTTSSEVPQTDRIASQPTQETMPLSDSLPGVPLVDAAALAMQVESNGSTEIAELVGAPIDDAVAWARESGFEIVEPVLEGSPTRSVLVHTRLLLFYQDGIVVKAVAG